MLGLAPAVLVGKEGVAVNHDSFLKAFDVALAQVEDAGSVADAQFACDEFLDDVNAWEFLSTQCDPPCHGDIFSVRLQGDNISVRLQQVAQKLTLQCTYAIVASWPGR